MQWEIVECASFVVEREPVEGEGTRMRCGPPSFPPLFLSSSLPFFLARVRAYTIIVLFFAFTAFTFAIISVLCFYLCLHPYFLDFQVLSPIGEGVKAICKHYM